MKAQTTWDGLHGDLERAEAERDHLRIILSWVALRYEQTLAGTPVRDADECLEAAKALTGGAS